jgi:acyl-coenzyme A thioesterase PaaI-like protein
MESLQDKYSPNAVCFGCGPANPAGLHIKSRLEGNRLVADWLPKPQHMAFAGFTNGGIISTLLDCHGNMTAAYSLMKERGLQTPPGTVTAELTIKFLRPSPLKKELHLSAWCTGIEGNRVRVEGSLEVDDVKTASMSGLYVAVKEGHPAFHKWE